MYKFVKAKPVWGIDLINQYSQFLGFHTRIELEKETKETIMFHIAARSYYRLFLNGKMVANGPARTAKGYSRVDVITVKAQGIVNVAIEVAAIDKAGKYCNDCTMEPGMLTAEIVNADGMVLAATGDNTWRYEELLYRKSMVETMSHSRGIVECCQMTMESINWQMGKTDHLKCPVALQEHIEFLERRSPYPDYHAIKMGGLQEISDMVPDPNGTAGFVYELAKDFNHDWYEMIPEENCFIVSLRKEKETCFTGKIAEFRRETDQRRCYRILAGKNDCSLMWGIEKSELGFIEFEIEVEHDCIVDVINSDHLHLTGIMKSNTYVSRYELEKGKYHIITFEPKLVRYIKFILRSEGAIVVTAPEIMDYSYPDNQSTFFECNDGDLNRIYEGARRTLRLSTLDIFMDCPQRERGGWLCDSQFSAYAAYQLFGDSNVEKDFIENFMLTDGQAMWHGFFPEVYPGSKPDSTDVGIANWSFWLMTQLYAYYMRTGDRDFVDECRKRVEQFIEGMLLLRGEQSGLIEGMKSMFVDWSLSNRSFALEPISVPINCLAVCLLENMAELYQREDWKQSADVMRSIILKMDNTVGVFGGGGDGAKIVKGQLTRTDCQTESGVALELWSGFHREDKNYISNFVNTMGVAPKFRSNPNVGKSNLFIGLMIRFDVLMKLGRVEELVKEIRELYLDELKIGSGTFFENYNALSGCHGFNGAAAAMITNQVLGLGQPLERTKTVVISPHPGTLLWARGSAKCSDGLIILKWSANQEEHILKMRLILPKTWSYRIEIPFEIKKWEIYLNDKRIGEDE